MAAGMLWLDDDKSRTFEEKVRRAAEYYQGKYGRVPAFCVVNKKAVREPVVIDGIQVRGEETTLPHHFLIGD